MRSRGLMAHGAPADAHQVNEWLYSTAEKLQAQTQQPVPTGALVLGLLIGLIASPLSGLVHEYGHALAARRAGLAGVALPRIDRARFARRLGFGLTRWFSVRDPRGLVRLDPSVARRDALAIIAAGPAAELALGVLMLGAALACRGSVAVTSALVFSALDCFTGTALTLWRAEGGYGDGRQLRWWLARRALPRAAAPPAMADPHEATSVAPPA
jgi:hypothetical protein